ncbi:MAG: glycosyltransferase [Chitinispirillaceae bacterium]
MRIFWDYRLFSLPYADRGVGVITRRLGESICSKIAEHRVFIYGNASHVPSSCIPPNSIFIETKPLSWKYDLISIPLVLKKYKIDLAHFWVALGPIHHIGLPLVLSCPGIATIHDMGVALWKDIPYLCNKSKTLFWKFQKFCIKMFDAVHFYTYASEKDYTDFFGRSQKSMVTYPPLPSWRLLRDKGRKPFVLTLGGAPHKNLKRVIQAFKRIHETYPHLQLVIAGTITREEIPSSVPSNIRFVTIDHFPQLLSTAAVFVSASYHEGLGLPMLEAMKMNCPMVLSEIPSHLEIAGGHAVFVDPFSVPSIAAGIREALMHQRKLIKITFEAQQSYENLSSHSAEIVLSTYNGLLHG